MKVLRSVVFLFSLLIANALNGQGSVTEFYNELIRGQDYVQTSVLLGQRYDSVGIDYAGLQQPASLVISGIPASAEVEKAFLWWGHYGVDTVSSATLTNSAGSSVSYDGELVISGPDFCWGPQSVFRSEVSDLVDGNGTFQISNLVTSYQAKDTLEDTDGATLLVVYSDISSSNYGHIVIHDGLVKAEGDTLKLSVPVESPISIAFGKAFMVSSDMEYYYDAKISLNGGNYYLPGKDFWDFDQAGTTYSVDQTEAIFAIKPDIDCAHILATGTLVNIPVDSIPAGINQTTNSAKFYIYPNPSSGIFSVDGGNYFLENEIVIVTDLTGRTVETAIIKEGICEINISDESNGAYIVSCGGHQRKLIVTKNR